MNKRMNIFYRFFCSAGGGNISVLNELPTERNRFFSYGAVICATAFFAFLSSSYAFKLLLGEEIGSWIFLPATAWALFIFLLDRFFIVSIPNRGTFWNKFKLASPRLLLAVFIGIIISKPLEYRIFNHEIEDDLRLTKSKLVGNLDTLQGQNTTRINNDRQTEIDQLPELKELQPLLQRIDSLKITLSNKSLERNENQKNAIKEIAGTGETKERGTGPAYDLHFARMKSLDGEIQTLDTEIKSIQVRIDTTRAKLQREIDGPITGKFKYRADSLDKDILLQKGQIEKNYTASILNQEMALSNIGKGNPTARLTVLFVTLLFIFIELAPMILKLMTKAGAYENRIAQIEATYNTEDRLGRALDMEEYKSNRGLVRRLARSQREIINSAMNNWHEEQMNKMKENPESFNDMFNNNNYENDNHTRI